MSLFSLSSQGLANVKLIDTTEELTVIVGNEKFKIPKLIAAFLSPNIANKLIESPKMKAYSLTLDNNYAKHFKFILKLAYGEQIKIDETNIEEINALGSKLGNNEILSFCDQTNLKNLLKQKVSQSNVISILNAKKKIGMNIKYEVEFIAANFYAMDLKSLEELHCNEIEQIISHPSLVLESESQLFNFISRLVQTKGQFYSNLFGYCHFEYLSQEEMERFIVINGNSITDKIWNAVTKRLLLPLQISSDGNKRFVKRPHSAKSSNSSPPSQAVQQSPTKLMKTDFPFTGDYTNGIFNKLRTKKGNLGYSSSSANTGLISSLVNPSNKTNFWTQNIADSWVRIDVKKSKVLPSSYTIRGRNDIDDNQCESWVFEGFSSGRWDVLDSHENEPLKIKEYRNFPVKTNQPYTGFRIRQTGKNTYGDDDLVLSAFEVFGNLIVDN